MNIESPCIGICTLKDNICIGCLRTIQEIAEWTIYTPEQKEEVLIEITTRWNDVPF